MEKNWDEDDIKAMQAAHTIDDIEVSADTIRYTAGGEATTFDLNSAEAPTELSADERERQGRKGRLKVKHKVNARPLQYGTRFTRGRHRPPPQDDWLLPGILMGGVLFMQTILGIVINQYWYSERAPLNAVCAIMAVVFSIYIFGRWARPSTSVAAMRRIVGTIIASFLIAAFFILV